MEQVEYSSLGVCMFEFSIHTFLLHGREYDPAWEALNRKRMFLLKKFKMIYNPPVASHTGKRKPYK